MVRDLLEKEGAEIERTHALFVESIEFHSRSTWRLFNSGTDFVNSIESMAENAVYEPANVVSQISSRYIESINKSDISREIMGLEAEITYQQSQTWRLALMREECRRT